jgi:Txe/YoeB family toxin of Txe-Axe toxin-antitoxin module
MHKYLGNYIDVPLPKFEEQLSLVSSDYKERIEAKVADLRNDPWSHNSDFMKGQYRGKRHIRLDGGDRLVYVICEECRHEGHFRFNRCSDCSSTPENTFLLVNIIFGHDYKGNTRW